MRKLLTILLCLGLVGCETAPTSLSSLPTYDEAYQNQPENTVVYTHFKKPCDYSGCDESAYIYKSYEIDIISDPPGAKIEWNDQYIGETPCKQVITGKWYLNYETTIRIVANPVNAGQYQQIKVLSENPIPNKIYFDMGLGPVSPAVDVNVNNGNQQ